MLGEEITNSCNFFNLGFNPGLKLFKNKTKEKTFFLPSPPSDVDTVEVELKLNSDPAEIV